MYYNKHDTVRQTFLIDKIKRGDRKVYSDFFREHYGQYVAYAMRYLRSKSDATDIVQNAFIRLWETRTQLDPDKSIIAYMYTIVRNLSLNHLRDHKHKHVDLENAALTIHHSPEVFDDQNASAKEVINTLIDQLPERQREAFELSRIDGLEHQEIAEIMGVSPRTVNNHIVAALKSLRKAYDERRTELLAL